MYVRKIWRWYLKGYTCKNKQNKKEERNLFFFGLLMEKHILNAVREGSRDWIEYSI
jgi:hypothetical protein